MTDLIELVHTDAQVILSPASGGSIAAFRWRGRDVMRPATAEALAAGDPLGMASFPLVPWSNRIADGRFHWRGRDIALPRNMGDHPHAIHGHGWRNRWSVDAVTAETATLGYDHKADAWPWDYHAEQSFTMCGDGFDTTLSVTNHSDEAMPAGLGIHPYFPNLPATSLRAQADGWWATDALIMPLTYVSAPSSDWTGKLHAATTTDNVFAGFDGHATLGWSGMALDMQASPAARWMVIYAPIGEPIVGVEPVTHPTDALNQPGLPGIRVLEPGERFEIEVHFRVSSLD